MINEVSGASAIPSAGIAAAVAAAAAVMVTALNAVWQCFRQIVRPLLLFMLYGFPKENCFLKLFFFIQ